MQKHAVDWFEIATSTSQYHQKTKVLCGLCVLCDLCVGL